MERSVARCPGPLNNYSINHHIEYREYNKNFKSAHFDSFRKKSLYSKGRSVARCPGPRYLINKVN